MIVKELFVWIVYMLIAASAFELNCPAGYTLEGQSIFTDVRDLIEQSDSFLLCNLCQNRVTTVYICINHNFPGKCQYGCQFTADGLFKYSKYYYNHQFRCDETHRHVGQKFFQNTSLCKSFNQCGINVGDLSDNELGLKDWTNKFTTLLPCPTSMVASQSASAELWCPSNSHLIGTLIFLSWEQDINFYLKYMCAVCQTSVDPQTSVCKVIGMEKSSVTYEAYYQKIFNEHQPDREETEQICGVFVPNAFDIKPGLTLAVNYELLGCKVDQLKVSSRWDGLHITFLIVSILATLALILLTLSVYLGNKKIQLKSERYQHSIRGSQRYDANPTNPHIILNEYYRCT